MLYNVAIYEKDNPRIAVEVGECTEFARDAWKRKAQEMANEKGKSFNLQFRPIAEVLTFDPQQEETQDV